MPIPSFLAYDGFDQGIDAVVLYKDFQGLHDQDNEHMKAPPCMYGAETQG